MVSSEGERAAISQSQSYHPAENIGERKASHRNQFIAFLFMIKLCKSSRRSLWKAIGTVASTG